jgi:hypothetical protein
LDEPGSYAPNIELIACAAIPPGTDVKQLKTILEATFGNIRPIQYVDETCVYQSILFTLAKIRDGSQF